MERPPFFLMLQNIQIDIATNENETLRTLRGEFLG